MLGTSCHLEISELLLIGYRNPDEADEGPVSASLEDGSSCGVSIELVRMESRPCSESSN